MSKELFEPAKKLDAPRFAFAAYKHHFPYAVSIGPITQYRERSATGAKHPIPTPRMQVLGVARGSHSEQKGWLTPLYITVNLGIAEAMKNTLLELEEDYANAARDLEYEFMTRALDAAPFLSRLKQYQEPDFLAFYDNCKNGL
jgi:hypothetical protein